MSFPQDRKYTADEYFSLTPDNNSERYELIGGEIYALAAPSTSHQRISGGIYRKIGNFIDSNKGNYEPFIAPFDVKLDNFNVVQPDVMVICDKDKLDDKRCYGAPDWTIEVLSENRRVDLFDKLTLYQKHGVREYWIVDPQNEKTLVYFFESSDFLSIYTFDTAIPVGIYGGELAISIKDLIH